MRASLLNLFVLSLMLPMSPDSTPYLVFFPPDPTAPLRIILREPAPLAPCSLLSGFFCCRISPGVNRIPPYSFAPATRRPPQPPFNIVACCVISIVVPLFVVLDVCVIYVGVIVVVVVIARRRFWKRSSSRRFSLPLLVRKGWQSPRSRRRG